MNASWRMGPLLIPRDPRGAIAGALSGALVAVALAAAPGSARAVALETLQHCGAEPACLAQLEHAAIRESGGAAKREGLQLTLQFGLNPPARFVDQPLLVHTYVGRLDGMALHVVRASSPAQRALFYLIGESDQAPLRVEALPVPGPGGRNFVVANGNTLTLYQRSGARWALQYRFEAAQGLIWAVKGWRADAAAVRLEWLWPEAPAACQGQQAQGALQLRDGPYGWDLVPPPPARCAQ